MIEDTDFISRRDDGALVWTNPQGRSFTADQLEKIAKLTVTPQPWIAPIVAKLRRVADRINTPHKKEDFYYGR